MNVKQLIGNENKDFLKANPPKDSYLRFLLLKKNYAGKLNKYFFGDKCIFTNQTLIITDLLRKK